MKKAYLIALTVVVVIFALTGCVIQTGNTDGKTGIKMSGSGGVESIPNTLTATQGCTFEFKLEANPTTGYTWQVNIEDEEIVELVGNEYICDDPEADGTGGITTLKFKALQIGETTVTLEYARDWEDGDVDKTKEIKVVVE